VPSILGCIGWASWLLACFAGAAIAQPERPLKSHLLRVGFECPEAVAAGSRREVLRTFDLSLPHAPHRLIVGLARTPPADEPKRAEALRAALGFWIGGEAVRGMHVYPGLSAVLLELAPSLSPDRVAEQLATCAGPVRYVELDYSLTLEGVTPDDWHWVDQTSLQKMAVHEAWEHTTGNPEIVVAVIDTGIDLEHPDLVDNLWENGCEKTSDPNDRPCPGEVIGDISGDVHGWNFVSPSDPPLDTHGHGTEVAGIIGARGNNRVPLGEASCIAGVAWRVSLVALKVVGGVAGLDPLTRAVQYATAIPADVINASLSLEAEESELLKAAVAAAGEQGVLLVAAAPRDQPDVDAGNQTPRVPCGIPFDNVICVTATDDADQLVAGASIGGSSVDLGATATGVRTTTLRNVLPKGCSGTQPSSSIAAPHVAGVAALLRARCPGLPIDEMRRRILDLGDPAPALGTSPSGTRRTVTGKRLNASSAVAPACPPVRASRRLPRPALLE
jgi:subtilisin family serine protease